MILSNSQKLKENGILGYWFKISDEDIQKVLHHPSLLKTINLSSTWEDQEYELMHNPNKSQTNQEFLDEYTLLHAGRIAKFVDLIQKEYDLPPLELDKSLDIIEGNHRLRAYQYLNLPFKIIVQDEELAEKLKME